MPGFENLGAIKPKGLGGWKSPTGRYEEFGYSKDGDGAADDASTPDGAAAEPDRPPLRHIDKYIRPECPCLSKRVTVALLSCIGFMVMFGMRSNMGIAKLRLEKETNKTLAPAADSSIFYGYLITQVPGGFLAAKYPANRLFGCAIGTSSFLNLLVPGALMLGPGAIIVVRVMQGLVEGVTYPACHGIWRYWAPPLERSRLATLAFCGCYAGVMVAMPLCGELTDRIGWQAPFYFYGAAGIVWFVAWLWLVFERPSKHPSIEMRELKYIESSLEDPGKSTTLPTLANVPWKAFFTSLPVWAIFVANFCRSWNFYLLVLFQPSFMRDVYHVKIVENTLLGALPHLLMTIIVPSGGILADYLRKQGIMTTTQVRKVFNCGGFGMEATFFLVVAFSKSYAQAMLALTFGVAFSGFAISGFNVNHLDIAPKYASILMGMSNGIGTIAGCIVPIAVHALTDAHHSAENWKHVFLLGAVVHFLGVTFYAIFASGELQEWADSKLEEQQQWNPMDETVHIKQSPSMPNNGSMQTSFTNNYGSIVEGPNKPPLPPPPSVVNAAVPPPVVGNPFMAAPTAGRINPFSNPFRQEAVQPQGADSYLHGSIEERNY